MPAAHYKVFGHPRSGDTAVIKDGFSWPAFFFSFIWALFKRLWLLAIALFVAGMVARFLGVVLGNLCTGGLVATGRYR